MQYNLNTRADKLNIINTSLVNVNYHTTFQFNNKDNTNAYH